MSCDFFSEALYRWHGTYAFFRFFSLCRWHGSLLLGECPTTPMSSAGYICWYLFIYIVFIYSILYVVKLPFVWRIDNCHAPVQYRARGHGSNCLRVPLREAKARSTTTAKCEILNRVEHFDAIHPILRPSHTQRISAWCTCGISWFARHNPQFEIPSGFVPVPGGRKRCTNGFLSKEFGIGPIAVG
jgi:hypothetical protein